MKIGIARRFNDGVSTTLRLAVLAALTVPAAAQQLAPLAMSHPEPPPVFKLIEPSPAVPDWLSYNYDQQRTGWKRIAEI